MCKGLKKCVDDAQLADHYGSDSKFFRLAFVTYLWIARYIFDHIFTCSIFFLLFTKNWVFLFSPLTWIWILVRINSLNPSTFNRNHKDSRYHHTNHLFVLVPSHMNRSWNGKQCIRDRSSALLSRVISGPQQLKPIPGIFPDCSIPTVRHSPHKHPCPLATHTSPFSRW